MTRNVVPDQRIAACNTSPIDPTGDYVLYWMIACRRTGWSFSLQRAVDWCRQLCKPLVVVEALRCGHPWASERIHGFVLDGMRDQARNLGRPGVLYYPYIEPHVGAGRGLLAALSQHACVVVTDEFPCFFLPHMVRAAATGLGVRLEQVDSNGLIPMRAATKAFLTAFSFRAFLQQHLRAALDEFPMADPLHAVELPELASLPRAISERWPAASRSMLEAHAADLATLPINHRVRAVSLRGGSKAAEEALARFAVERLSLYAVARNHPDEDATSRLSPYLHFGQISAHQIFAAVMTQERWTRRALARTGGGRRSGWWGVSLSAESFLDQLVVWRELGFNMCAMRDDYDQYDSLPAWAQATLAKHAADRRTHVYTLGQLEAASTHDALWNAAQTQLVRDGWFHGYLRMLWAKKILEWSPSPREALAVMVELMNKYSLDGRDPNSYTGFFWALGRYDRPWGPERPVFGTVRYMSSQNTARKLRIKEYMRRYTPGQVDRD